MEPWLAGKHADLDPLRRLLACSLDHALADLHRWTPASPNAAIAFHLRHLAGSVDRLWTYALGGQLNPAQLAFLAAEAQGPGDRAPLLAAVPGRQRIEVPLGLLLGHIAEHTQRHTGQLISLSK